MYGPIGYYLNADDAVCAEHYEPENWEGFEGWDEPLAIFEHDEADSPTHCTVCEDVIEHSLTSEGYDYVREALDRAVAGDGRRCIVRAWVETYLADDEAAISAVADWPERDDYSPGGAKDRRAS